MFRNIRTKWEIRRLRRAIKGAIRRGTAEMNGKPPHLRDMISEIQSKLEGELAVVEITLRNYNPIAVLALKIYMVRSEEKLNKAMIEYNMVKMEWEMS